MVPRPGSTTNDTGEVVALAVRLGERLWRDGFRYSKTGIMITELLPETIRQASTTTKCPPTQSLGECVRRGIERD
jgi:hypothetical protein